MAAEAAATIAQLETARKHVLIDANHYNLVIPGVLPLIGANSHLSARRWGAGFLAESFASPIIGIQVKESLGIQVLPLVHELLEKADQDEMVVKSIVQTAASIYGPVFRHVTNNPHNTDTWAWMAAIKANILRRLDSDPIGSRICCIKFVQRVVQVQTPGPVPDPRRPEQNDISIAAVPRDHPSIPPSRLEPEASGLLDRLLAVLYEESKNPLLVDATLNGFAILARVRPTIANKIVTSVINFNPLGDSRAGMSMKEKVSLQSMDRTTYHFLSNYTRRNQGGPLASRIDGKLRQLKQQRIDLFDDTSRKRGAPIEPTDGLDSNKRARLGANGRVNFPPLPPGPVSVAQLYTLTEDAALKSFDVSPIPIDIVVKVALPVLQRVDAGQLDLALSAVRSRYLALSRQPPSQSAVPEPSTQTKLDVEDEDDYEPEFEPTEDDEQILNKMDALPPEDKPENDLALGTFKLPQPPPLTKDEAEQLGKASISRTLSMMNHLDEPSQGTKLGLNRLAGSAYDKNAWITLITRLATRAHPPGLQTHEPEQTPDEKELALTSDDRSLGDGIRETLWKYVIEDFRHRIDIAISWLNEEWYNDKVSSSQQEQNDEGAKTESEPNYDKWVLKVLDAIIPYLDANDKVLVRFLGEIPAISKEVLERVKNMARDPDRVTLTVKAIYYLVAFKPPSKEDAIDALQDLWENYPDAKASVRPLLARIRPKALEEPASNGVNMEASDSVKTEEVKQQTEPAPVAAAG